MTSTTITNYQRINDIFELVEAANVVVPGTPYNVSPGCIEFDLLTGARFVMTQHGSTIHAGAHSKFGLVGDQLALEYASPELAAKLIVALIEEELVV